MPLNVRTTVNAILFCPAMYPLCPSLFPLLYKKRMKEPSFKCLYKDHFILWSYHNHHHLKQLQNFRFLIVEAPHLVLSYVVLKVSCRCTAQTFVSSASALPITTNPPRISSNAMSAEND